MKFVRGERVGRQGTLRLGASATIFDAQGRLLLTQRRDNGLWCLPGGGMDPGESITECCVREVREETGLAVCVVRLLGVYSDPDWLALKQGQPFQIVALNFLCEIVGGTPRITDETLDIGWFDVNDLPPLLPIHPQRIADALVGHEGAFVR
jgi:8-oxo-dGTP pyrophosphatase MutT (NUDIX family)